MAKDQARLFDGRAGSLLSLDRNAATPAPTRIAGWWDPAAAHGDGVLVAEPLILGVDTEIGGCIGASTRHPQRRRIGFEPKRSDFDRVVAKARLDREAPIRRNTVDRVRAHRVDAK